MQACRGMTWTALIALAREGAGALWGVLKRRVTLARYWLAACVLGGVVLASIGRCGGPEPVEPDPARLEALRDSVASARADLASALVRAARDSLASVAMQDSLYRVRAEADSLRRLGRAPIELPALSNTQLASQLNELLQPYRERSGIHLGQSEVYGLEVSGMAGTFAPLSASGLYRYVLAVEVPRLEMTIDLHERAIAIEDSTRSAMRREINHLREAILAGSRVELGLQQTVDLQAESIDFLNARVAELDRSVEAWIDAGGGYDVRTYGSVRGNVRVGRVTGYGGHYLSADDHGWEFGARVKLVRIL